jgi:hypothetical protein
MACVNLSPEPGLLYPDCGSHYTSRDYLNLEKAHGTVCSISRRGNYWDSAA